MQASGWTVGGEYFPGRGITGNEEVEEAQKGRDAVFEGDEAAAEAFIRKSHHTTYHGSCTNRMARDRESGVLDSQCRVFGVERLRVIDASSFPILPPGHPQASVYALAERIATCIVQERSSSVAAGA